VDYLLTPWCRVLLEKLAGLQLVKKFPAFYGTRRFITALTSVRHLSVSWASPFQSIYSHPTSCRSILILSTHLHLGLPTLLIQFFLYIPLYRRPFLYPQPEDAPCRGDRDPLHGFCGLVQKITSIIERFNILLNSKFRIFLKLSHSSVGYFVWKPSCFL
jgi:hypothetical protein